MDRNQKRSIAHIAALSLILGGCVGTAYAQDAVDGAAIRGGFYRGGEFQNGASRVHLEGFEIGGDIPISRKPWPNGGVYFSPTLILGGSNRKGNDTDGNIYDFLVNVKQGIADSNVYGGFGIGYGLTQARIHEFHNVSGLALEYLLGYTFHAQHPGQDRPFLEATYHDGAHAQLRGLSVNLGLRF